jgi:lysophospholipase L1-like esterase
MRIYLIATTVTALLVLTLNACKSQDEIQVNKPINYLALGDSYTIGQGVEELQRWPNQLTVKLVENGYEVVKTDIIAQTGWRTSDLINAIPDTLAGYNLVSLLIGVNNQFRGQPFGIFSTEFDLLLDKSIALAGGKEGIFVLSIPDYGVTPFGSSKSEQIAQDIDRYNDYIKEKCVEQDIPFVDVTLISRLLGDSPGALASDNLHPSGFQYKKWMEAAFPKVIEILAK